MAKKPEAYSAGFKFLHWLIALIVILMLSVTYFLDALPKQYVGTAFILHKSFGITVLFLMLFRLLWLALAGRPALPASMPTWERYVFRVVQCALYFFLILMPLCGWIMSMAAAKIPNYFGLFPFPLPGIEPNKNLTSLMMQMHNTLAIVIIVLLVLHIAGALKHYFIDKDRVFQRMLPGD